MKWMCFFKQVVKNKEIIFTFFLNNSMYLN